MAQRTRRVSKAAVDAPLVFSGYVVDRAGVFTPRRRAQLTERLGRFERETKHQLVVVSVTGLHGQDVATFTLVLANRWGVGRAGFNDGIVILVAPHQHTARIEVGRGLEGQLTNSFCAQVMNGAMVPAFARGRVAAGIEAGVDAIIARLAASASGSPRVR